MTPEKPAPMTRSRNRGITRVGSTPYTPAMTGVWRTTGSTSRSPISITMAFASPIARSPALEPKPFMR